MSGIYPTKEDIKKSNYRKVVTDSNIEQVKSALNEYVIEIVRKTFYQCYTERNKLTKAEIDAGWKKFLVKLKRNL